MEAKALSYLSLARKAGLAELGEEPVGDMARTGKAYLIAVAADASDHTWRRAKSFAAGTEQQCVRLPFTKEDMGIAVGVPVWPSPPSPTPPWPWPCSGACPSPSCARAPLMCWTPSPKSFRSARPKPRPTKGTSEEGRNKNLP